VQYERWWIPIVKPTAQNDVSGSFSLVWYPKKSYQRQ